jgi:predicted ATPase/DNA-binding CsgD family transcriptional regulator
MTAARRKSNPPVHAVDLTRSEDVQSQPPPRATATHDLTRPSISLRHNNLALPRSPLIGRDHEVATIQHLLLQEQVGLLTLTGPGGIGKTRLALQVAANVLDHFVDGVYLVSLAPISDPDLVASAIAQTVGVWEAPGRAMQESLQEYLRDKQLLLVLDNFEQILPAAPLVSALLTACRRLKVLVTSRASLHLYGEQEFPVAPLALPILDFGLTILDSHARIVEQSKIANPKLVVEPSKIEVNALSQFAAIDLFCQRARAVKPDFALTPENAAAVAQICIGLDGLPLALELAAARIKLFSPAALLARLDQRLTLLTSGSHDLPTRQRTLREEIAWSYDLLSGDEQKLFRRLAVFVGGFTLEAAQAVGDAPGDLTINVLEGVAALLDHNLLKPLEQTDGEARFTMLATIREYGLEQLNASGEAEMICGNHAHFFMALAEAIEPRLAGPPSQSEPARVRLRSELDNLRLVFAWSQSPSLQDTQPRAAVGARLACALAFFPFGNDHMHELRRWLETTLQWAEAPTALRAKALWGAGMAAIVHGDYHIARAELEESVALYRTLDDQGQLAAALRELCLVAYTQRDLTAAQRYGEESLALYRTLNRQSDLALALEGLGSTFVHQGNLVAARTLFEEQLALARLLDQASLRSGALVGLGWIARQQGDFATARKHFTEALTIRRELHEEWMIGEALDLLGELLQQQGAWEEARHHYLEGLSVAHAFGDKGGMALILYHLSTLVLAQCQPMRAARLLGVATALQKASGGIHFHAPTTLADWERTTVTVQTVLGAEQFADGWAEGQAMRLEEAIAFALTTDNSPETTAAPLAVEAATVSLGNEMATPLAMHPAGLTAREVEVLRLLVQGLTYAQIADKLVISRRTVNVHLTSIYSKLGVTSRATATRFAEDQHLV